MRPCVSVIIPVYNASRVIGPTVKTIQGQTLKDIEILLVDDGSTDDTLSLLRTLAGEDARIRVEAQRNAGVFAARNAGLSLAEGEYVYVCDQDDFLHPRALEYFVWACKRYGIELLSFWNRECADGHVPTFADVPTFEEIPICRPGPITDDTSAAEYCRCLKAVRLDVWTQFMSMDLAKSDLYVGRYDTSRVFRLIKSAKSWALTRFPEFYCYNREPAGSMVKSCLRASTIEAIHDDLVRMGDVFAEDRSSGDIYGVWETVRRCFISRVVKMQVNAVRRRNGSMSPAERHLAKVSLANEIHDLKKRGYTRFSDMNVLNALRCLVLDWRHAGSAARGTGA